MKIHSTVNRGRGENMGKVFFSGESVVGGRQCLFARVGKGMKGQR